MRFFLFGYETLKWPKSHYLHIFWFCYNWRHVRDYPQHCWIQRFPNLHLRPERKLVRCIKPPHCYPRSNNAQCLPHLHMMKTYSHYICKGLIILNRAGRVWFRYFIWNMFGWISYIYIDLYWYMFSWWISKFWEENAKLDFLSFCSLLD